MSQLILASDLENLYTTLNELRANFELAPINTVDLDNITVKADHWNTFVDLAVDSVEEYNDTLDGGQIVFTTDPEKVVVGSLIRKNPFDAMEENFDYFKNLCMNYSFNEPIYGNDYNATDSSHGAYNSYYNSDNYDAEDSSHGAYDSYKDYDGYNNYNGTDSRNTTNNYSSSCQHNLTVSNDYNATDSNNSYDAEDSSHGAYNSYSNSDDYSGTDSTHGASNDYNAQDNAHVIGYDPTKTRYDE